MRLGNMRVEQQQRYLEDIAAEEERCYALGSLSATSGRVLSIALHAGPIPGLEFPGLGPDTSEHVFGIDKNGYEEDEKHALQDFVSFMKDFDADCDELVGHNIIGFDLPFIFQRCPPTDQSAPVRNLSDYNVAVCSTRYRCGWARSVTSVSTTSPGRSNRVSKTAVEGAKFSICIRQGNWISFASTTQRRPRNAKSLRTHGRELWKMTDVKHKV